MNKALFLDRDGTLNFDIHHLHKPEAVVVIPGTADALAHARKEGFRLYLVTNQSGVGRGYFQVEDVYICIRRLLDIIGLGQDLFDGICIAPERPDQPSNYRKPSPLYLQERIAADGLDPSQCYMLGDRKSDWECGRLAGVIPVALRSGKPLGEAEEAYIREHGVLVFDTFAHFVKSELN